MNQTRELELYIHIPFCVQKCKYCDFLSAPATRQVQTAYMEALLREVRGGADIYADVCVLPAESEGGHGKRDEIDNVRVTSVFIGGGTPSSVEPEWICKLMEAVRQTYVLAEDAEITMEMNPGTVTKESLAVYRKAGVNRLSIGLQSAEEKELKILGRIHDYDQFLDSYTWGREAGFNNINVDLMCALPEQTMESLSHTLHKVTGLSPAPEHISLYSLIVEEGTSFYEMEKAGRLPLPDEDMERRMYWAATRFLKEAGYEHYEISNYAKPGFSCRHNSGYWKRTDYLGMGIGAASMINNIRFKNSSSLKDYIANPLGCREEIQRLSVREQMEETMFLGLRMAEGVDLTSFKTLYEEDPEQLYGDVIHESIGEGLLQRGEGRIWLTCHGVNVSNYVMAKFLLD